MTKPNHDSLTARLAAPAKPAVLAAALVRTNTTCHVVELSAEGLRDLLLRESGAPAGAEVDVSASGASVTWTTVEAE